MVQLHNIKTRLIKSCIAYFDIESLAGQLLFPSRLSSRSDFLNRFENFDNLIVFNPFAAV